MLKDVMKIKKFVFLIGILCCSHCLLSQTALQNYFPRDSKFDRKVPTPVSVLGHEVGQWHVSHDKLVQYVEILARASKRVTIKEYARSHESRALKLLTFTSPENHERIEEIRNEHLKNCFGASQMGLDPTEMPVVVYMGYSVHGNESSGANAALLLSYYLAAGQSDEIDALLKNTVILVDPCMNPDGFQRFSGWANSHRSYYPNPDDQDREHHEVWPNGRTNHYWFDLNRDWLLLQHPESVGRVNEFKRWMPNVLIDAHEMGTNSTYFFQPGIPSRNNPETPDENFELTQELANFHAAALDSIGSIYYSKESFDDFYYGKGSTYPDANGCIGILFEQASSRGHIQNSIHGDVTFPFTIRNQLNTSLSTLRGCSALQEKLNRYQGQFFADARREAKTDKVKAFVFGNEKDPSKAKAFSNILKGHGIEIYRSGINRDKDGVPVGNSQYVVPTNQNNYRLIKAIFDKTTTFSDSLFYDVSSWTIPLAFDLDIETRTSIPKIDESVPLSHISGSAEIIGGRSSLGYAFELHDYFSHKLVYQLLRDGVKVKITNDPITITTGRENVEFSAGAIVIPVSIQPDKEVRVHQLLERFARSGGTTIYSIQSGLTPEGNDLGSPSFSLLRDPKVALLVGKGVNAYEAGEVWHLLDKRFRMRVTLLDKDQWEKADLSRYNTLILVNGNFDDLSLPKLESWLKAGGVLITQKNATNWLKDIDWAEIKAKVEETNDSEKDALSTRKPYRDYQRTRGAQVTGGAIFQGIGDLSHPILYGFKDEKIPIFRNHNNVFEITENPYATPLVYSESPLISGYVSDKNLAKVSSSAALIVKGYGSGRIIAFADNPNFRAFWYGTNKLFLNAVFLGHTIRSGTTD